MKTLLLATALTLVGLGSANATDWWILGGQSATCVTGVSMARKFGLSGLASPAGLEAGLRETGRYRDTDIERDSNGKVKAAIVSNTGDDMTIAYYSSKEYCEEARARRLENGTLHDPNELK